jgi:Cytochrome P460
MIRDHRLLKVVAITVALLCALAAFLNYRASSAAISSRPGMVKEIEGYRGWTKVNEVPQLMAPRVAMACARVMAPGGVDVNGSTNPHTNKFFTVYVNDVGREAMVTQKNPTFPVGTVIVKEKLPSKESQTPELLTVMIKQKEGFNEASGDWEYAVMDGTGTRLEGRGDLQNCQSCHVAKQGSDYVFRTYLSNDAREALR